MKAIVLYQQGGIDKLTYTDYATPEISETEILVQVEACACLLYTSPSPRD